MWTRRRTEYETDPDPHRTRRQLASWLSIYLVLSFITLYRLHSVGSIAGKEGVRLKFSSEVVNFYKPEGEHG
ncbi:unnamed protein product [Allacma fusca]|uniref:Uncharacterized protein n=1 Tax=Allacma fusca TaxID=39272 RepID=A0A8J2JDZ0_9HEXA|nr:unnamed protein product [Allacma fusca]